MFIETSRTQTPVTCDICSCSDRSSPEAGDRCHGGAQDEEPEEPQGRLLWMSAEAEDAFRSAIDTDNAKAMDGANAINSRTRTRSGRAVVAPDCLGHSAHVAFITAEALTNNTSDGVGECGP